MLSKKDYVTCFTVDLFIWQYNVNNTVPTLLLMVKIPGDKDTVQTPFIKSEPLDDEINLRLVKRRRYFMGAVEVPTLFTLSLTFSMILTERSKFQFEGLCTPTYGS